MSDNAKRDDNQVTTLLAVSSADGVSPVRAYADPTTHRLLVDSTKNTSALTSNSATPTFNTDSYQVIHITGQAVAITSMTSGLSGTPKDGDILHISITGTGSIGITWGTSYEASTIALPTTTSGTTRLDMFFTWNTETTKWRIVLVA